jgi:hypothetical protein
MAIDFPKSPTIGQTYTANSITWQYDGYGWRKVVSGGSGGIIGDYVISVDGMTGIVNLPAWTNTGTGFINGIAPGISFDVGSSAIDVLEKLIYPYQPVNFVSGSLNIGLGTSPFDLGRTFAAGTYTAQWSTSGPGANWVAGSIVIRNSTTSTTLATGLNYNSSPVGVTHAQYGYTAPNTLSFGITGSQLSGSVLSDSQSYRWAHRIYWGKSSSASISSISNITTNQNNRFTSSSTSLGAYVYSFAGSTSAEYCYIITPTSPGTPGTYNTWRDPNNLSFTPVSGTFTETNSYGVSINWTWYQVSNPTTSLFSVSAS